MRNNKKLVSLIFPVFNEEESLPLLLRELKNYLNAFSKKYDYEIIFIDDGSSDKSLEKLEQHKEAVPHITLRLSRNFGHQAALYAGLETAQGDYIVTLDSDLQHPLSIVQKMLEEAEAGADIVLTEKLYDSSTSFFKKTTSSLFYSLLNKLSQLEILESSSDFRLLNREACEALLSLPEKRIFLRGMVGWIGFKVSKIKFTTMKRQRGVSKYSLKKMIQLALFGISSFSTAPLYLAAFFGFAFSLLAVMYGGYVLYIKFVLNSAVAGWSSVTFTLLSVGSVLSFLMAILGVYIAALYDEVKQRPIYIVKKGK